MIKSNNKICHIIDTLVRKPQGDKVMIWRKKSDNIIRKSLKMMKAFAFICLGFALLKPIEAKAQAISLSSEKYEQVSIEEKNFNTNPEIKKEKFYHGESVGELFLMTDAGIPIYTNSIGNFTTYETDAKAKLVYRNNNPLNKWSVVSSSQSKFWNIEIDKVKEGSAVIQKSYDGVNWTTFEDSVQNILKPSNQGLINICEISYEDIKRGVYYRINVLYELEQKKGKLHSFCTEVYTFFLCYNEDPVRILDISGRGKIPDNGEVRDGFVIEMNGANASVEVKRGTVTEKNKYESKDSFYKPGNYTIITESSDGKRFEYHVTVTEGITNVAMDRKVYANPKKEGYSKAVFFGSTYCGSSLTNLSLATDGEHLKKGEKANGYDIYGVEGEELYVILRINKDEYIKNGWQVVDDEWGQKEKQTIEGTHTGYMSSGALVVQKSINGSYWIDDDLGRYSEGLYTTDYTNIYGNKGDVLVYTIDGTAVLNGVYLRILYAYKIKQINGKEEKRIIEEYSFYICYDSLGAITFHNLTENNEVTSYTEDETEIEILRLAETLKNESFTRTGFTIDVSGSPTVQYWVFKDGHEIDKRDAYTENGRYSIKLLSKTGSERNVTIYVDSSSKEELLIKHFSESGPVLGKHVFSEGKYPVFEEGKDTKFIIQNISINESPFFGEIVNLSSGEKHTIYGNQFKKEFDLSPGEYEVNLYNNSTCKANKPSGDVVHLTMHFQIIPEETAPGPVVNQRSLENHMLNHISSSYPKYYGLSFSSSGGCKITLAFRTWEDAFEYASDYEANCVQFDEEKGKYRYSYIINGPREEFDSEWELTERINEYAELAIQECYFDMSDKYYYQTLPDSIIEDYTNIRKLELNMDVVIFAEGQESLMKDIDALPIINSLPYAIFDEEANKISFGRQAFSFTKDDHSYDSHMVSISDANGKRFYVEYNKDVEEQLAEHDFCTGKISITERTKYGDSSGYEAVYFANGDNTAKIIVTYILDDDVRETVITQSEHGANIVANLFTISDIMDDLDPYDLVLVKRTDIDNAKVASYTKDDLKNAVFDESGEYSLSVINRIGNKFEFNITLVPSDYATIVFEGDGTDDLEPFVCKKGSKNIQLSAPKRAGYIFIGYSDADGILYDSLVIDEIDFIGKKVLKALWKSAKCHVYIKDSDGNILSEFDTEINKKHQLNLSDIDDDLEIDSWIYNGTELGSNEIEFINAGDYDIIVTFRKKQNEIINNKVEPDVSTEESSDIIEKKDPVIDTVNSDITENTDSTEKSGKRTDVFDVVVIVILILLVIAIAILIVYVIFKMKNGNDEKPESEQDNAYDDDNDMFT